MLINCDYCDAEFYKKPSQIKKSKNHFCSKDCSNKWKVGRTYPKRRSRIKHKCHQCNQKIEVENYKFKQFLSGEIKNLFCSKQCLANWQKLNFKGEKSSNFNSVIKKCLFCKENYQVAKSRKNTSKYCSNKCHSNSRIEDIEVLCDYCNKSFTKKRSLIRNSNFCTRHCSTNWNSEFNNRQVLIECLICNKSFNVQRSRAVTAKSCSQKCHNRWLSEHYAKSDEGKKHYKRIGLKGFLNQEYSETKPERIFSEFLIHNNIDFVPQLLMYDKFVVDFYLPKNNMVIEVFGDYWHGNPNFYGDEEGLKPLSKQQNKQKEKDRSREKYIKACGHEFHIMWEDDIYNRLSEITQFLIE